MEPLRDFYFSASEARGEYFSLPVKDSIVEYRDKKSGTRIWCTEVTEPGVAPVSQSKDLLCVARNCRATFIRRLAPKRGDLWAALNQELHHANQA